MNTITLKELKNNYKSVIKTCIVEEMSFIPALLGLSFNKNQEASKMYDVAKKLANQDEGHNKFLESIYVSIAVKAPRHWWQEADTYRLATKQSQSTMHTIYKRNLENKDFENAPLSETLKFLNDLIDIYNDSKDFTIIKRLKSELPEGFLQARCWTVNYKTLRNLILQRKNHRLDHWKIFLSDLLNELKYPEFLPIPEWFELSKNQTNIQIRRLQIESDLRGLKHMQKEVIERLEL